MDGRYALLIAPAGEVLLKAPPTRRRLLRRLSKALVEAAARRGIEIPEPVVDGARLICPMSEPRREALEAASKVFGVYFAALTTVVEFSTLDDLAVKVEAVAREAVKGKKFAVRAHRYGRDDFTSLDVAREVGAKLKPYSAGVDLENPEVEVYVEVRRSRAYVYTNLDKVKGPGGLPPASEGRVLALFSGGLDSPVAAWYIARRGAAVDLLHVVVSSPASAFYAARVAAKLAKQWFYGYTPRMIVLPRFAEALQKLLPSLDRRLWMLGFKLLLYSVADELSAELGYDAIVTGESVGQTSSQTLTNIRALHAVLRTSVPILRPLLGFDKEDSTSKAMELGIYEEASRTPEYSALVRRGAETGAQPEELEEVASAARPLARMALEPRVEVNLLDTNVEARLLNAMPIELEYIPCDALVVEAGEALDALSKIAFPRPLVLVFDEVDEEAKRMVLELRDKGVNAYAYSVKKSGPPQARRVIVEPGEGGPKPF